MYYERVCKLKMPQPNKQKRHKKNTIRIYFSTATNINTHFFKACHWTNDREAATVASRINSKQIARIIYSIKSVTTHSDGIDDSIRNSKLSLSIHENIHNMYAIPKNPEHL